MICIQNICGKATLFCLTLILIEDIYDGILCSKTPFEFKGLAFINIMKDIPIHLRFNIVHHYQECALTWKIAQTLMRRRVLPCFRYLGIRYL